MFDLHQVSVGTVIQVSADQAYVLQGKALVTICACVVMYIYIYRYSMCSDASLSRCLSVSLSALVLDWQDQVAKVGADLTQARWSLKIHAHCACVCVCARACTCVCFGYTVPVQDLADNADPLDPEASRADGSAFAAVCCIQLLATMQDCALPSADVSQTPEVCAANLQNVLIMWKCLLRRCRPLRPKACPLQPLPKTRKTTTASPWLLRRE